MVHQMYSRYWVTYRNDNRQYIANVNISRVGISFQDHHTLKTSTDDGNSKAGKPTTCRCMGNAKYFMEWTSSTLCTCPKATASGSEM